MKQTLAGVALAMMVAGAAVAQSASDGQGGGGISGLSGLRWKSFTGELSFGVAHGPAFEASPFSGLGSLKLSPKGPGLNYDALLGTDGPSFLEWTGSYYRLTASRTVSQTNAVSGSFTKTSGTLPQGTITVDTTPPGTGAQINVQVSAPGATTNATGNSPSGSSQSISTFQQTATGGVYAVGVLDGTSGTSAGYGIIYDQNGVAVTGVGVSGWTVLTSHFSDTTTGISQGLAYGRAIDLGQLELRPKIGLEGLRTTRTITESTTYALDTTISTAGGLPTVSLGQTERLRSTYLALMLGADASRPIGNGWALDAGLSIGRGHMTGRYSGASTISISGTTSASQQTAEQRYSASSWMGRTSIGLSRKVSPNLRVSMGIFVSYLSAVPSLVTVSSGSGSAGSGTTTTASLNAGGQVQYTRSVVEHSQLATGISLGLVYRF
ncbi:hypothetical protein [Solirhodobacter olei]|uniref:hypothetical protein n=1 Tax=Solirhodobacter olei TaxID=2493082 RepID=UPI000FD6C4AD|nr:hypothetical protein [Solirhodobacter olei]